jgi:hypothetical protein
LLQKKRDIFICHASEDKKNVVIPLTKALDKYNITYWLDQNEIKWGDSLIKKINEGLGISKYVLVVLSIKFINKNWTQRELNSVLNLESSNGEVVILPLIVGNENDKIEIFKNYPLLNDKLYLKWDKNEIHEIIENLQTRIADSFINNTYYKKKD